MADSYSCECLDCGHKFTSEEHCADSKCPECGGKCRRSDRPGDGKENRSEEMNNEIIHLSMDRPSHIELIEDSQDSDTYKLKFELMDIGTYNSFNFSEKNLDFMVEEFKGNEIGVVSHGLDHSWKTLEQLGRVYEIVKEGTGKDAKVFAKSELYKETDAQKQAHILFKQGLLKFVSGGWFPTKYSWNEETETIDITNPKLREISSTPMPAKENAKQIEILNSLNHSLKNGNNDSNTEIEMSKEDTTMADDKNKDEPSEEGMEISELKAELAALKAEQIAELKSLRDERVEMATKADAEIRVSLLQRASELKLSEELFKDSTNKEIEISLKAAKELQVKLLQEKEPEYQFQGEDGVSFKDGSPEMIEMLIDEHFQWAKAPAGVK